MGMDACSEASRQLLATSAALLFITIALVAGTLPTILRAYKRARTFEQNLSSGEPQSPASTRQAQIPRAGATEAGPEAGAGSPPHPS